MISNLPMFNSRAGKTGTKHYNIKSRSVSRVLSHRIPVRITICLSERLPFLYSSLPADCPEAGTSNPVCCLALLLMRFAVPFPLPEKRWALTPPFHPYPEAEPRGGIFSAALSIAVRDQTRAAPESTALQFVPQASGRYPASCSAEPGLSSSPVRPAVIRPA